MNTNHSLEDVVEIRNYVDQQSTDDNDEYFAQFLSKEDEEYILGGVQMAEAASGSMDPISSASNFMLGLFVGMELERNTRAGNIAEEAEEFLKDK